MREPWRRKATALMDRRANALLLLDDGYRAVEVAREKFNREYEALLNGLSNDEAVLFGDAVSPSK